MMAYQPDLSDIIAGLAFVFSTATYIIHDQKIKKQERLLNAYKLENIEEEKRNKRSAQVKANLIKGESGNHTLIIFNAGKSKAENVKFLLDPEDQDVFILNRNIFPLQFLNPQESVEVNLTTHKGSPNKLTILLTWSDDVADNNQHRQIITI